MILIPYSLASSSISSMWRRTRVVVFSSSSSSKKSIKCEQIKILRETQDKLTPNNSQKVFRVDEFQESLAFHIVDALVFLLSEDPLENFLLVSEITLRRVKKRALNTNSTQNQAKVSDFLHKHTFLQGLSGFKSANDYQNNFSLRSTKMVGAVIRKKL